MIVCHLPVNKAISLRGHGGAVKSPTSQLSAKWQFQVNFYNCDREVSTFWNTIMLKTVHLYNNSRFGLEYILYVMLWKIGTLLLQKIVKNKPTF